MWHPARKFLLLALLLCFAPLKAQAQSGFIQVSGTITDPQGFPYAGGSTTGATISAILVPSGGTSPTLNGKTFATSVGPIALGNDGSFTIALADNTVVVPSGTQWQFTVVGTSGLPWPIGRGSQAFQVTLQIHGNGLVQDISSQLSAAAPSLTNVCANSNLPAAATCGTGGIGGSTTPNFVPFTTAPDTLADTAWEYGVDSAQSLSCSGGLSGSCEVNIAGGNLSFYESILGSTSLCFNEGSGGQPICVTGNNDFSLGLGPDAKVDSSGNLTANTLTLPLNAPPSNPTLGNGIAWFDSRSQSIQCNLNSGLACAEPVEKIIYANASKYGLKWDSHFVFDATWAAASIPAIAHTASGEISSTPASTVTTGTMNVATGSSLLVVTVPQFISGTPVSSVTDTAGNSFTLISAASESGTYPQISFYKCSNCTGNAADAITVHFNASTTFSDAFVWNLSGNVTFTGLAVNSGTSATPITSTFNTSSAGLVLAGAGIGNGSGSATAGSGYTRDDSLTAVLAAEHQSFGTAQTGIMASFGTGSGSQLWSIGAVLATIPSSDPCGSNCTTITTQSGDVPFTSGSLGKIAWATNTGFSGFTNFALQIPQTTITAVNGPHSAVVGAAAFAAPFNNLGTFVWGDDDTTAVNLAWADTVAICGKLLFPAGAGIVQAALFQSYGGCAGGTDIDESQTPLIQGQGTDQTFILPSPNFDFTTCGNACLSPGGVNSISMVNLFIYGTGQPGSGTLNKTFLEDVSFSGSAQFWMNETTGTVGCHNCSATADFAGFGATAVLVTNYLGNGSIFPSVFNYTYFGDSATSPLTVNGSTAQLQCNFCQYGQGIGTDNVTVNQGIFTSVNGYWWGNCSSSSCSQLVINTGGVANLTDNQQLNVSAPAVGWVLNGGTLNIKGVNLASTGFAYTCNTSGTINDEGGNSITATSGQQFGTACTVKQLGYPGPVAFAGLPTKPLVGFPVVVWVTDGTVGNPCTGGGSGALASWNGSAWVCK